MSETVLTLDLGVTTGYAVFTDRELIDYSQTTVLSETLPLLLTTYTPDIVIVEEPLVVTRGELADKLSKIRAITRYFLVDSSHRSIVFIEPSHWKPTPAAKEKCPRGTSQHEKDAIRIGYWFFRFWLQGDRMRTNVPT